MVVHGLGALNSITKKLKKTARKAKFAAKVGVAAAKVIKTLGDPRNQAKMVTNLARGKGLVYPTSTYIGPGNSIKGKNAGGRKAKSKTDRAAYEHDKAYQETLARGVKPSKLYLGFSDADQRLLDKADPTTEHGLVAAIGMGAKKIGHQLGLTGKRIKN